MAARDEGFKRALQTVRALLDLDHPLESIWESPLVPVEYQEDIKEELRKDDAFTLVPAKVVTKNGDSQYWLNEVDRSKWYYWPQLRQFLFTKRGFSRSAVRSIEESSDKILSQLASPSEESFDVRGLVLGYVQSGKTANYTALIAKAVDAGYRLVIVLSGIDNGLRRQTNIRLKRELVGSDSNDPPSVALPPAGKRWHEFTKDVIEGDFQPGFANHAALQGQHPVLLVIKKNADVLRRLLKYLDDAPRDVLLQLPVLVIDDEADQASIDTKGDPQADEGEDVSAPSVINGLIRELLSIFRRRSYIAYTATPFANILIPHYSEDANLGDDLYPKDFIVDLPKPRGYFGTEEFFGRMDSDDPTGKAKEGLDVVRVVSDKEVSAIEDDGMPQSLRLALVDFILAGAARSIREGDDDFPATMLVHTSRLTDDQKIICERVDSEFSEIRDAWRYHRGSGVRDELITRWNSEFRPVTRRIHLKKDASFEEIESRIGPFMEAVRVKEVNSVKGDVLDYEREPALKAIAVGGNRLSRGLTLEGLLVSYFVRRSPTYDTLMQMGRWFGFRSGYEDLTRIYTTGELKKWFTDLALVELQLREDIGAYEERGVTPRELGMRIREHPSMQVTSPLKRRYAGTVHISQSYSGAFQQTFKFPFENRSQLEDISRNNQNKVSELVEFMRSEGSIVPLNDYASSWSNVSGQKVVDFLTEFSVGNVSGFSPDLIVKYIEKARSSGELGNWTVSIRGRQKFDEMLGSIDLGLPVPVNLISRTRLQGTESLGVVRNPDDEIIGLSSLERKLAKEQSDQSKRQGRVLSVNTAARQIRSPSHGLLLIYPISRNSGHERNLENSNREPLFKKSEADNAPNLIGVALSFPFSKADHNVEAYLEGTVGWRSVE